MIISEQVETGCHPSVAAPLAVSVDAIRAEAINKWYGAHHALRDVSLNVQQGTRVVICGPSGSGKSTLIRCVNGLEDFQKGALTVDGVRLEPGLKGIEAVRRQVGMVFQQFNLFPHLSVLENCILAPVHAKRTSREEAIELAMAYLKKVRIPEQAQKFPGQLSGGQQQRVAIARALCMQPRLMLFDEPTSALDPEMVKEVLDTMVALAEDGMTMLCVTHEMSFARQVADKVIFMDDGALVFEGTPSDFFKAASNQRVRNFIGQLLH